MALITNSRHVLKGLFNPMVTTVASMKFWPIPPDLKDIEFPEQRKLPMLDKVPQTFITQRPMTMEKRMIDVRGPERIHNQLIYKQFGIMALCGAHLKFGHLEMIRFLINKHMDVKKTFAVWRIDPPWKAVSRKSKGRKMGGGKASISYYVTPIRAGRVIVEVGGAVEYEEVYPYLNDIAIKLPCDAMVVSEAILKELREEEEQLIKANQNPFTFEYVVKNKLYGCHHWTSKYDLIWHGKYT